MLGAIGTFAASSALAGAASGEGTGPAKSFEEYGALGIILLYMVAKDWLHAKNADRRERKDTAEKAYLRARIDKLHDEYSTKVGRLLTDSSRVMEACRKELKRHRVPSGEYTPLRGDDYGDDESSIVQSQETVR